jgi:hypothetical protein
MNASSSNGVDTDFTTHARDLRQTRKACRITVFRHKVCIEHYTKLYNVISISNIILVSITGISNNITSYTNGFDNGLNIIYSILMYISAALSSIQKFYNYAEKIEQHKIAFTRYSNLLDTIEDYLNAINNTEEYFRLITEELREIKSSSPYIPSWVDKIHFDESVILFSPQEHHEEEKLLSPVIPRDPKIDRLIEYEINRFKLNTYRTPSA